MANLRFKVKTFEELETTARDGIFKSSDSHYDIYNNEMHFLFAGRILEFKPLSDSKKWFRNVGLNDRRFNWHRDWLSKVTDKDGNYLLPW